MNRFAALIAALAVTGCVQTPTAAPEIASRPYKLSAAELAVVQKSVAAETLIPSRARVTNVMASTETSGVVEACGYVSGIEFSGLYGPPRAFSGVLGDNVAGAKVFVVVLGIAQSPTEQLAKQRLCAAKGMPIASLSAAPDTKEIGALIAQERALNTRCRGTEGANPASTVCTQRNEVGRKLNTLGWCYGRQGEPGYQNEWHSCQANSVRLQN